jgi:hypothetical protein
MKRRIEIFLLWLIAIAYLWVGTNIGLIYLDDGAAVFGAWNILAGKIPYRDFMVIGGPVYFYLLAAIFKITGSYLIVDRILNMFVFSGISILVYVISLEIMTRNRWATVAYILSLVCLGSYPHYSGAQPMAVFWSLTSTAVFLRWFKNPKNL